MAANTCKCEPVSSKATISLRRGKCTSPMRSDAQSGSQRCASGPVPLLPRRILHSYSSSRIPPRTLSRTPQTKIDRFGCAAAGARFLHVHSPPFSYTLPCRRTYHSRSRPAPSGLLPFESSQVSEIPLSAFASLPLVIVNSSVRCNIELQSRTSCSGLCRMLHHRPLLLHVYCFDNEESRERCDGTTCFLPVGQAGFPIYLVRQQFAFV
jgi:hypothetical protein